MLLICTLNMPICRHKHYHFFLKDLWKTHDCRIAMQICLQAFCPDAQQPTQLSCDVNLQQVILHNTATWVVLPFSLLMPSRLCQPSVYILAKSI